MRLCEGAPRLEFRRPAPQRAADACAVGQSRGDAKTPAFAHELPELDHNEIAGQAAATFRVESVGGTRTERVVSLVLLGDLMSLYLAVLRGVDPSPVPVLDRLKAVLAGG